MSLDGSDGNGGNHHTMKIVVETCESLDSDHLAVPKPGGLKAPTWPSRQNSTNNRSFVSSVSDLNERCESQLEGVEVPEQTIGSTDSFLSCAPPTLLDAMRHQWRPLLLPAGLLATAIIVSAVAVSPGPTEVYYLIAYALSFAASALCLALGYAIQMKWFLGSLADWVPRVFAGPFGEALSTDPQVRYVQTSVYNSSADAVRKMEVRERNEDPLAFMRDVIAFKSLDLKDGHCIVDHTGTVMWCNDALAAYFGWADNSLVGENVRVLMPEPYCTQHDTLIRGYTRGAGSNIVGSKRRVPVVDRSGTTSTVLLGVEEYVDPMDPENYMFLGSMGFSEMEQADPAMTIQDRLKEGATDILKCCAPLATHPDCLIVINMEGTIQWVNDSATWMLQYGFGELAGKNIKCLMGEEHARQHDGFLARYQERADSAFLGAGHVDSRVVGRSRDLYAKTKSGELIRIYLSVKRLDRPSRLACDCLFLGSLLLVQKTKDEMGSRERTQTNSVRSGNTSVSMARVGVMSALTSRKCTLVVLEMAHLDHSDSEILHRDLSAFFNIAGSLSTKYKAVLHHPVGDRLYISLNNTLTNNAHRSSAGNLLHSICQQWKFNKQQSRAKVYAVGVTGTCMVGQFMTSGVMLSKLYDISAVLLRLANELDHAHPIIDASLFEDLQFAYGCRPINVLTMFDDHGKPEVQHIYELQALKVVEDDEWVYQLGQSERRDASANWRECWEALGTSGYPDYSLALEHLSEHLHYQPKDMVGCWLRDVVRARQSGKAVPVREVMGKLEYSLLYRNDDMPVSRVVAPTKKPSLPRPIGE